MLNKLIIHLKNIIFFKLIIYALSIIGLLLLLPIFKNNLTKSLEQKENAILILDNIKNKLELVQNFDNELEETIAQYKLLTIDKIDLACQKTKTFLTQLTDLNKQYTLLVPISYTLSNHYEYKDYITSNNLTIECNIIDIEFTTSDKLQLDLIQQEIYKIAPHGSVILEQHIEALDVITPSIIHQLTHYYSPNLLKIKIKLMLRNAKYKK
ncbi:MAG: hypothetical protein H6909_05060 [Rickettsiaceae bacterium]|nr:hypothetical protein [Rickettsiaceae bacterium]